MSRVCNTERALVATEVRGVQVLGGGYAILEVEPPACEQARPGQFAMLRVPDRGTAFLHRPMSILEAGRSLDFLIREVGTGSRSLSRLSPGDSLELITPLGQGFPEPVAGEVLCGGGVGASPLLFQARAAARLGLRPEILYGGRTAGDLVLADRMQETASLVCVTEDGSRGTRGLATDPLAARLGDGGATRILACGPIPMMAGAARLAMDAGVPCLVCLEALMACGFGACLGCAIPDRRGGYLYVCSDGPVLDAAGVDWEGLGAA